jgi:hypothetical protein
VLAHILVQCRNPTAAAAESVFTGAAAASDAAATSQFFGQTRRDGQNIKQHYNTEDGPAESSTCRKQLQHLLLLLHQM